MTDYTELVKSLRETDFSDGCPCCAEPLCKDADCVIIQAADAIERLVGESIILPFPVGTEVWSSEPFVDGEMVRGTVETFTVGENGIYSFHASFGALPISCEFLLSEIGSVVFLKPPEGEETWVNGRSSL